MVSFKRFYKVLTEIPAKNFLTTDQVANFVTKDIYEKSKPDECLLQFLEESIKAFSSEIEKLVAIALPKLVSGFNTQKGAIFGFGPSSELEPTGNVLKLCNTDSNILDKLDTQSCSGMKCWEHQLQPCNIWQRKPDNSITTKCD